MESGLAVDMVVSGTTEKAHISIIIMNEDLTTAAKKRKRCAAQVQKKQKKVT